MKKTNLIPAAVFSANESNAHAHSTVDDLINQMRSESSRRSGGQSSPEEENEVSSEAANHAEKKSVIPKAVVSADTVSDLIDKMQRESGVQNSPKEENEVSSEAANHAEKKSVIPKAVVSADSHLDKLRDMLSSGEEIEINPDGTLVAVGESKSKSPAKNNSAAKAKTIPKAVVSAGQWYETNKELYNAEVAAMRREFNSPNLKPKFLSDGRMYWVVNTKPNLGCDESGNPYKTMTYKLLLVYDADHPKVRYGSSVKVYPIKPTIDDLQRIVNRLPGVTPKNIPHTLIDSDGIRYLCTADTRNVSADISRGITSAVTSYRFAYRWLSIFELGIRNPEAWARFQRHGEI